MFKVSSPLLLLLLWCFVLFCRAEDNMAELSRQVAETNKALEELLASKLRDVHYATVIGELRAEIDALRRDVVHLKEAKEPVVEYSVQQQSTSENEQKTLQWLQNSLAEMRAEIVDVTKSVNISRQLQLQQQAAGQLHLIRSDVTALQAETADASAHRHQLNQSIDEVSQLVRRLDGQQRINIAQLERLENNMADLRIEMEFSRQTLKEEEPSVLVAVNKRRARSVDQVTTRKVRHQRKDWKHEVETLRKMVRTLAGEQHDLQKQVVLLSQLRTTAESNVQKVEKELQAVIKKLEEKKCPNAQDVAELSKRNRQLADSVEKLGLRVSGVDQVQSSTLQLFETLERLEERYDESIGELQREMSKLELSDGQLSNSVHTIQEDQKEQMSVVKALSTTTSILQEQLKTEQVRSALLMAKLTNNTLAVYNQSRSQSMQDQRLDALEHQSSRSVDELKQKLTGLTHNLPHDCREVNTGASGVNFILPRGEEEVIKVYCDQETSGGGWTVVQRRTDGKEDFNRNWAAYKSGFGSIHGEFWLGNDHLHRLTRDNTTMLRVDLWDIYGQYWWAEYDSFVVDDESAGYAVQFYGYTGNASDAMASYHQSMKFSTRDNDQDLSNTNCADSYQGGWWYSHCQHVNINGKYALGLTWYDSLENEWIALARVEMKVRDKRIFNNPL